MKKICVFSDHIKDILPQKGGAPHLWLHPCNNGRYSESRQSIKECQKDTGVLNSHNFNVRLSACLRRHQLDPYPCRWLQAPPTPFSSCFYYDGLNEYRRDNNSRQVYIPRSPACPTRSLYVCVCVCSSTCSEHAQVFSCGMLQDTTDNGYRNYGRHSETLAPCTMGMVARQQMLSSSP